MGIFDTDADRAQQAAQERVVATRSRRGMNRLAAPTRDFQDKGVLGMGFQALGAAANLPYEGIASSLGTRPTIHIEPDAPQVGKMSEIATVMSEQILGSKGEHWEETPSMMVSQPGGQQRFGMLQDLVRSDPGWTDFRKKIAKRVGYGTSSGANEAYWNIVGTAYLERMKEGAGLDVTSMGANVALQGAGTALTAGKLAAVSLAAKYPAAAASARGVPILGRMAPNVAAGATPATVGEIAKVGARDITGLDLGRMIQGGATSAVQLAGRHPRMALAFGAPAAAGAATAVSGGDGKQAAIDAAKFTIPVAMMAGAAGIAGKGQAIDDASGAVATWFTRQRGTMGGQIGRPLPQALTDRKSVADALARGSAPVTLDNILLARGLGDAALPQGLKYAIGGAILGGMKGGEEGILPGAAVALGLGKAMGTRAVSLPAINVGGRQLIKEGAEMPLRATAVSAATGYAVSDALGGEVGMNTFMAAAGAAGMAMGYRGLFAKPNGLLASMFDQGAGDFKSAVGAVSSFLPQKMFRNHETLAKYFTPLVEAADTQFMKRAELLHENFVAALGDSAWDRKFLRKLGDHMEQVGRGGEPHPDIVAKFANDPGKLDTLRAMRLEMDAIIDDMRRLDPDAKYEPNYWPRRADVKKVVYGEAQGVKNRWAGVPKDLRAPANAKDARLSLGFLEGVDIGQAPMRKGGAYESAKHMMVLEPVKFFSDLRSGQFPTSFEDAMKLVSQVDPKRATRNIERLEALAKVTQGRAHMGTVLDIVAPASKKQTYGLFDVPLGEAKLPDELSNPFLKGRKGGGLPLMDDPMEVLSMYITKYLQKKYYEPLLKPTEIYKKAQAAFQDAHKRLAAAEKIADVGEVKRARTEIASIKSKLTPEMVRGFEELDMALVGQPEAQNIVSKLMKIRLGHPDPGVERAEQFIAGRIHPVLQRSAARTVAGLQYLGGLGASPMSAVRGVFQSLLGATAVGPTRMVRALKDVTANPDLYENKLMRSGGYTSPVEELFNRSKQHASTNAAKVMFDETMQGALSLHQWADQRARMYSFAAYERWALETFDDVVKKGPSHDLFRAFDEADRTAMAAKAKTMPRADFAEMMGKSGSDLTNWIYGVTGSPSATRGSGGAAMVFTTWPANYIGLLNSWMRDDQMAPKLLGMAIGTSILDRVAYEGLGVSRFTGLTNEGSNWGSDSWLSTFPVQGGAMGMPPLIRSATAGLGALGSMITDDPRGATGLGREARRSSVGLVARPAERMLRMYSDDAYTDDEQLGAIFSYTPAEKRR